MAYGWLARRLGMRTKRHGGKRYAKRKGVATKGYVRRVMENGKEKKFTYSNDTQFTTTLTNSVPSLTLLNGIARGNSDQQRIGDRVKLKDVRLQGRIYCGANNPAGVIKLELLRIKNPRGVAPTESALYNSATPQPTEIDNDINIDWKSRFERIGYKMIEIKANYSTQDVVIPFHFKHACEHVADYSLGNNGTIADIDTNAIYFNIISDVTNAVTVNASYKLHYEDM